MVHGSMFLCLRQFLYFVIYRITMQQPTSISISELTETCLCLCACVRATTTQIGWLCAVKRRWQKKKRENKNGVWDGERARARNKVRKTDRQRERGWKKKCVLHAEPVFILCRWLKHFFLISYYFFSCFLFSISFQPVPFANGYAVSLTFQFHEM